MLRRFITALSVLALSFPSAGLLAQQEPQNIVLERVVNEYEFMKPRGSQANISIVRKVRNSYRCRLYASMYKFTKSFATDRSSLSDFQITVDERRRNDIEPAYTNATSAELYLTERLCSVGLPFASKGISAELQYRETFQDPRLFDAIMLSEPLPLQEKKVVIHVPSWMTLRITEWNFGGMDISRSTDTLRNEIVYTYLIRNFSPHKPAADAPGHMHIVPHLMLELQRSIVDGNTQVYFEKTADFFAYCHGLLDTQALKDPAIAAFAEKLTKGLTTDSDKVRTLYHWVQQNVRYIALEDGIAAFRPDKASEVLRKKYGDCKGMSNLLVAMIRSIGLEAGHCWLGTKALPYDFSLSSLGVADHAIAAWVNNGRPVYLDGTATWAAYGDIPEAIQGREVLREDRQGFVVERIPAQSADHNLDLETRNLRLEDGMLKGKVSHVLKGHSKWLLLEFLHQAGKPYTDEALLLYFSRENKGYEISNITTSALDDPDGPLTVSYEVVHRNAVNAFDGEIYLDADNRRFDVKKIDTANRKVAYVEPYKRNHQLELMISLPKVPAKCVLPQAINLKREDYVLDASWSQSGNTLLYHSRMQMNRSTIPVSGFAEVNADFERMRKFYATQPELHF